MQKKQSNRERVFICSFTAVLAVATYYLLPASMDELARRTVAIFLVAAIFWATEVLPLYATSLCIIGMGILFLADKGGLANLLPVRGDGIPEGHSMSYKVLLSSFSSPIIILFMGGFLLSAAVTKHGLDRAIASRILRPFNYHPLMLIFGVMLITAFFSMWMSNTATTVMMLAIISPLVRALPQEDKFHRAVILAVPFGANIGGIGTPIGTPPNAVALAALNDFGIEIGFVDWMLMAVPLAAILLVVAGLLLYRFFPPGKDLVLPELEKPTEKISTKGRWTLIILSFAILLWLTGKWHGLAPAAVALLAAAALTALGVLRKHDVDSIDWNVLILMWGGLSLGKAMEVTNLISYIGDLPIADLTGFALASSIVLLSVILSTFMSNTATAIVIIPMVIALVAGQNIEGQTAEDVSHLTAQLVILTALACSFAMAMPVSTPPNAIAFATGKVPVSALIRSGALVSFICIVALLLGYQWVLPVFPWA
jgi:solute carrier family 13 (sodium-dependent dicarboxylate transporter), member 2/3/5